MSGTAGEGSGIPAALRRAYEAAWVEVEVGGGRFVFPPVARGTPPALPSALRDGGHVITACNPRSEPLPFDENIRRQEHLAAEIDRRGWRRFDAVGHDGGAWREPSFAVVGAPREEVFLLARRFEQHAVYEFGAGVWRVVPVEGDGGPAAAG